MFSKFRRLGIRAKWLIYTFMFISLFSTTLVSFFITAGKRDLKRELKKWGESLAKNLAENAYHNVQTKNYAGLNSYLYGIMNYEEIIYSAILDESGSILAIDDRKSHLTSEILDRAIAVPSGQWNSIFEPDGSEHYCFIEPILMPREAASVPPITHHDPLDQAINELNWRGLNGENQRLGTVILGVSLKAMTLKMGRMRIRAIYIASLSTVIVFGFVLWGVGRLTQPIKQLDRAARLVASGNLSHTVTTDRQDELGNLARSFNEMIQKLKQSQEQIENYTKTLENRVAQRTRELQLSEQKYRTLFEHVGNAVVLLDKTGRLLMVNHAFEALSGYSRSELEQSHSLIEFLDREDCQQLSVFFGHPSNHVSEKFPINQECLFIDLYCQIKRVNLTINEIPGDSRLLVSIVDVTELRELQKQVARSEHLAVLGELSAAIAHEIRNPLVAINTSAGILKNSLDLEDEDKELLRIISEESMRLNKIIDDFLKFARPNEPHFQQIDVQLLIQETVLLFRSRFHKIAVQMQLDQNLRLIYCDPDQIRQVLMNLFINAIEAMPIGGILTIVTQLVQTRPHSPEVMIKIKDTGVGIAESNLKRIFQPFFTTKKDGIGMGLAVCERIIQNHDGSIHVQSQLGFGTEFVIVLPFKNKV